MDPGVYGESKRPTLKEGRVHCYHTDPEKEAELMDIAKPPNLEVEDRWMDLDERRLQVEIQVVVEERSDQMST